MKNQSIFHPIWPQNPGQKLTFTNLIGSSAALSIANLAKQSEKSLLIITPDSLAAQRLEAEIQFFGHDLKPFILNFPDWETLPYDIFSPHQDIISARLKALYQLPRCVHFARFHVGLVKRIDADHRTGYGGCHFPLKEDFAQVVQAIEYDSDHGLAGRFQCRDMRFYGFILVGLVAHVGKHAVLAVMACGERLAVNRNQAVALFAGGFGKQLLEPGAQIVDRVGTDQSHFVAMELLRGYAQHNAELDAGVGAGGKLARRRPCPGCA